MSTPSIYQIVALRSFCLTNLNTKINQSVRKIVHRNTKTGAEMEYTLVGDHEANLMEGKLSVETPIGHALLGHKKGDKVEVQVPVGIMEFEIINISI